jgi:predicted 2-oxoglutarate/Fe(II)-dependent dioxygenase YbiX
MVRPSMNASEPGILLVPDFYDPTACAKVRQAMDRARLSPAEIYADGYRVVRDVRCAFDVEISDDVLEEVQHAIDAILPDVSGFFRIPLSSDEGPSFVRYVAGGFYRRHRDVAPRWNDDFPRRISVVLALSSAGQHCEGGALRVYRPEPFDIVPRAGTLVAFPAHLPHEVLPVTEGVRDVVVDWLY